MWALGVLQHDALDGLVHPVRHVLGHVLALEHLPALFVDHHPLRVHHVVVLEDVLAGDEVLLLDFLLRTFDLLREDSGLHRLVVGKLEPLDDPVDPVAGEEADEVVLRRQVEARLAGIALAPRAAPQLVVDPPGLVAFRSEDVQAAELDERPRPA